MFLERKIYFLRMFPERKIYLHRMFPERKILSSFVPFLQFHAGVVPLAYMPIYVSSVSRYIIRGKSGILLAKCKYFSLSRP